MNAKLSTVISQSESVVLVMGIGNPKQIKCTFEKQNYKVLSFYKILSSNK